MASRVESARLAAIFGMAPAKSIAHSTGMAFEFFAAVSHLGDASRCKGGGPVRWAPEIVGSGLELHAVIPPRLQSITPATKQVIADVVWDGKLLSSFTVDGRELHDVVQPLVADDGGSVGWVVARVNPTVSAIVATTCRRPLDPDGLWRARELPGSAFGTVLDGSEVKLVDYLWSSGAQWLGSFAHPPDVPFPPSNVGSLTIRADGKWETMLRAAPTSGWTDKGQGRSSPSAHTRVQDQIRDSVLTRSAHASVEDVARAESIAEVILTDSGALPQKKKGAAIALPSDVVDAAVDEALRLLSLDGA